MVPLGILYCGLRMGFDVGLGKRMLHCVIYLHFDPCHKPHMMPGFCLLSCSHISVASICSRKHIKSREGRTKRDRKKKKARCVPSPSNSSPGHWQTQGYQILSEINSYLTTMRLKMESGIPPKPVYLQFTVQRSILSTFHSLIVTKYLFDLPSRSCTLLR